VHVGDTVIIAAFGWMEDAEARTFQPKVLFLDGQNRPTGGFPAEIVPAGASGATPPSSPSAARGGAVPSKAKAAAGRRRAR
jgi:aspartate 1-decarboxylase